VAAPALIALPWLVVPAVIMLAVSEIHPVFDVRYVLYSQPALALLCAAGLSWLADRARTPLGGLARPVAWLPSVLIAAVVLTMLVGAQHSVRRPWLAGSDNLRRAVAILAARERCGDAILYLPGNRRIMSMAYPAPFRRLNDVALAVSPAASGTLSGIEVSAATLTRRFSRVHRVWVITLADRGHLPGAQTAVDRKKLALIAGMRLDRRWRAGALLVILYSAG
jgi:mannosyltransferase